MSSISNLYFGKLMTLSFVQLALKLSSDQITIKYDNSCKSGECVIQNVGEVLEH